MAFENRVVSQMAHYFLFSKLHLTRTIGLCPNELLLIMAIGFWTKVVHKIGNRVPYGMHPEFTY